MGIDLNGAIGYRRFSFSGWADAQVLAMLHGWEPTGTYIEWEDPPRWMGYYYNANSGQSVRGDDARNMADALTRSLDNLVAAPEDADNVELDNLVWPPGLDGPRPDDEFLRRPFVRLAGDVGRANIEELIALCAAGGFRIS